jgi:hypothetical protein
MPPPLAPMRYTADEVSRMGLRGVVRGRTIELEADPHLPDGTQVEVELRTPDAKSAQTGAEPDPLWGLLADQPELIESLRQVFRERSQLPWRISDETSCA